MQQPNRVGHGGRGIHTVDVTYFNHLARIHDCHPIGNAGHHTKVVCHEHDGCIRHFFCHFENVEDLCLHGDVQRRRRFVGEQYLRLVGDGESDHYALAHATREFVWVGLGSLVWPRDAYGFEQFDGALERDIRRDVVVHVDGFGNLVTDRLHRVQCRQWILEDHRDVFAAMSRHLLVAQ